MNMVHMSCPIKEEDRMRRVWAITEKCTHDTESDEGVSDNA
jgi:hypothetical protein